MTNKLKEIIQESLETGRSLIFVSSVTNISQPVMELLLQKILPDTELRTTYYLSENWIVTLPEKDYAVLGPSRIPDILGKALENPNSIGSSLSPGIELMDINKNIAIIHIFNTDSLILSSEVE